MSQAQYWNPRDVNYYERQWRTQAGAWAGDSAPDTLATDVAAVVTAFRTRGTNAGLNEARRRRVLAGANLYLAIRAETEERLAARAAGLRAAQARTPTMARALELAFVEARLGEVRAAVGNGHTPPQAVVDKPEVPRREIPRWVPVAALILSALAFLRSGNQHRRE